MLISYSISLPSELGNIYGPEIFLVGDPSSADLTGRPYLGYPTVIPKMV